MLRREFKIYGGVAGDNFKDGLLFVSLVRQIESGTKAGYKECEIVEAVIMVQLVQALAGGLTWR